MPDRQPGIRPTKEGDIVMYASTFLRNTGQFFGEVPTMEGEVTHIGCELCTVKWQNGETTRALYSNLVLKDKRHLELP